MANRPKLIELTQNEESVFKALFGPIEERESFDGSKEKCIVKCISLPTDNVNFLETDSIIIRPCYEHLLPHIHNSFTSKSSYRAAVTGTPGVGTTVFGVFLLRHFVVDCHKTVLYWHGNRVFLFSFNENVKNYADLKEVTEIDSKTLYGGTFDASVSNDWYMLVRKSRELDILFLHDPNEGDRRVSEYRDNIPHLLFVLSHGHSLISHWNTKGIKMNYFYMPTWAYREGLRCLKLLGVHTNGRDQASQEEIAHQLFYKFGGCIRGWAEPNLWDELESKITEVVKNQGDDVLKKTTSTRGSIIHLQIIFDEKKPILDLKTAAASESAASESEDESDEDTEHNTFDSYQYIFGSDKILELFRDRLLDKGDEAFRMCLKNWAGLSGFESVYGAMFELHCHRMLESNRGKLCLKMRIVYEDKSKNTDEIFNVVFPELRKVVQYPSNDPSLLGEKQTKKVDELNYFWPTSSNHPTYDSAVVLSTGNLFSDNFKTEELGMKQLRARERVALLLQMTVSGATGLPRRPEHSVKQNIRKKFEGAFKKKMPAFKKSGVAVTAFMVPTECFGPFLFQKEETMEGKVSDEQPNFQLVFEVPHVFTYKNKSPKSTSRNFDFSKKRRKRTHDYDENIGVAP